MVKRGERWRRLRQKKHTGSKSKDKEQQSEEKEGKREVVVDHSYYTHTYYAAVVMMQKAENKNWFMGMGCTIMCTKRWW